MRGISAEQDVMNVEDKIWTEFKIVHKHWLNHHVTIWMHICTWKYKETFSEQIAQQLYWTQISSDDAVLPNQIQVLLTIDLAGLRWVMQDFQKYIRWWWLEELRPLSIRWQRRWLGVVKTTVHPWTSSIDCIHLSHPLSYALLQCLPPVPFFAPVQSSPSFSCRMSRHWC